MAICFQSAENVSSKVESALAPHQAYDEHGLDSEAAGISHMYLQRAWLNERSLGPH